MNRQTTPDILGDVLAGGTKQKPTFVKVADIRRDGGMQPRAQLNLAYVQELVDALQDGATLPPVDVTYDGADYWLWDGYHRLQAHDNLGLLDIAAIIHQGDQVSAQWASFGTNQAHGLRRSNEDKERAIRAALKHPKAVALSNVQIAKHLGVDEKTIRNYREKMEAASEVPRVTERLGADGKTYSTADVGAKLAAARDQDQTYMAVWQIENLVVQGIANSPAQLRAAATGARIDIWGACKEILDRVGLPYRSKDLVQALNNVASQREQRDRYNRAPAEEPAAAADPAAEPDPWRAAYNMAAGSRQAVVERLARALLPWLREYRDAYDRGWQDIAERGNVAHTNSTLWQDIQKEQQRRGLDMSEGILKDAIKQAFNWLAAAEATAPAGKPMLSVFQTDEEREIEAGEAAADEAVRMVEAERLDVSLMAGKDIDAELDGYKAQGWRSVHRWDQFKRFMQRMVHEGNGHATAETQNGASALLRMMRAKQWSIGEFFAWKDAQGEVVKVEAADGAVQTLDELPVVASIGPVPFAPVSIVVNGAPLPVWVTEEPGDDVESEDATIFEPKTEQLVEVVPVSQRDGYDSDEWYTPAWVIEAARQVLGAIDLDPASCELAQEVVQAKRFLVRQQNGATQPWAGRVWLNPPYSMPKAFVEKLLQEYVHGNVKSAVVLLNNATETEWFQLLLSRFPVCFLNRRLAFWRHDHADVGARQGQAVFYLGPDIEGFDRVFAQHGIVVRKLG